MTHLINGLCYLGHRAADELAVESIGEQKQLRAVVLDPREEIHRCRGRVPADEGMRGDGGAPKAGDSALGGKVCRQHGAGDAVECAKVEHGGGGRRRHASGGGRRRLPRITFRLGSG